MNKRLSSNVHHIVIRVTDHYLPKAKGDGHQVERTDALERKQAFSFIIYIKKLLLLAIISFLMLPGQSMAEETMCRDLKPVNNLDELLYQFYINLDSDCLFTMPLSELEEAWGIKILSQEHLQPGQKLFELRDSVDFAGKPYHSEVDAFYVKAFRRDNRTVTFTIYMTDAYDQTHGTLFPEGNYPRLLPDPIQQMRWPMISPTISPDGEPLRYPQNSGEYSRDYHYFWLNVDRTHMILISTVFTPSVGEVTIYDEIPSGYLKYITE